ncbi:hypothetical protein [Nocardioides sp. URHA0032]|uniref:hypothetical protein n=1 Tax=Nocardioides sp. URHA0032 TaxID=1380388 RepID=UPI0004917614|nr:hypothetical protein [Nocardioides sp. URHA0032]
MTTLHDRLADLADDAPPGGPAPDLWDRGMRYHRQRRAGTAVIAAAAVVLLAVVAGAAWQRSAPVPAPARGPVGLPDRMWSPSPWLSSTSTPGQLVALTRADRGSWTGTDPGVVGVSATSGEYAFVELPGVDLASGDVELAPDGRHLAYWLTGPTTDTPNSLSGPITGVAVYDTVTGEVAKHWIATAHGLMPDFLTWADADTVVYSAGEILGGDDDPDMDQASSSFGTVTSWDLGGAPAPVAGVERGASLEGAGHGRVLLEEGDGHDDLLIDVDGQAQVRHLDIPSYLGSFGSLRPVALAAGGEPFALVPGDSNPGSVSAGAATDLRDVPGTERTFGVLDWVGSDEIVTLARLGRQAVSSRVAVYRVDVSTGRSRVLVRFPDDSLGGEWQFATDLLDAPSVDAPAPPSPLDPRVTAGLAVAVCLAAVAAIFWWRRRVRA